MGKKEGVIWARRVVVRGTAVAVAAMAVVNGTKVRLILSGGGS